jgi:hypothetical protein
MTESFHADAMDHGDTYATLACAPVYVGERARVSWTVGTLAVVEPVMVFAGEWKVI